MLGIGVGFDVLGEGQINITAPNKDKKEIFVIPDSRVGWADSAVRLLECYFHGAPEVEFDYSEIRAEGEPIKTFGGIAPGPEPLRKLHLNIRKILDPCAGKPITIRNIVDLMNVIGKAVVSGGVRRTAEIAFGPNEDEYLDLKNYDKNPEREEIGWISNNSIFAELGMDYTQAAERTRANGEPGYIWLENARAYSRMRADELNWKDVKVDGMNPCSEQPLEGKGEVCCLVELFPARHDSLEDFQKSAKAAYLYAKIVTLGKTQWPDTNRIMLRNRRIGCSVSGVAQFLAKHDLHTLKQWLNDTYEEIQRLDKVYSDWLAIPRSIKTTSVKPSGTISILAGATPGLHYPESRFYIRRIRLQRTDPLVTVLGEAGYKIEKAFGEDGETVVAEIPVDVGEGVRTLEEVSMWEQLSLATFLQREWSDNSVSCTVTFNPETEGLQIKQALNYFQYQLKAISFLPRLERGAYKQMPYEEITEKKYKALVDKLSPVDFSNLSEVEVNPERFCDGATCEL
jgi:ribonucleoside-triphosphate reductase (thioredoxin)